jgi:hypothetical protein
MTAHRLPSKPPVVIRWLWPLYGGSVLIALLSALLPRFQQLATLASAPSPTGQLSTGEAIGLAE